MARLRCSAPSASSTLWLLTSGCRSIPLPEAPAPRHSGSRPPFYCSHSSTTDSSAAPSAPTAPAPIPLQEPAAGMTTASDPVALAQALIRCESVTPAEAGALTLLAGSARAAGFQCHRMTFSEPGTPDVENLYARFGTTGPNLCFAGHTDVVPPGNIGAWTRAAVRRRDPRRRSLRPRRRRHEGRRSPASSPPRCATSPPKRQDAKGSISLLITGDEEGDSDQRHDQGARLAEGARRDARRLRRRRAVEPQSPSATRSRSAGAARSTATSIVEGKQGHAAYPHIADNPVPKLARIIDRLCDACSSTAAPRTSSRRTCR